MDQADSEKIMRGLLPDFDFGLTMLKAVAGLVTGSPFKICSLIAGQHDGIPVVYLVENEQTGFEPLISGRLVQVLTESMNALTAVSGGASMVAQHLPAKSQYHAELDTGDTDDEAEGGEENEEKVEAKQKIEDDAAREEVELILKQESESADNLTPEAAASENADNLRAGTGAHYVEKELEIGSDGEDFTAAPAYVRSDGEDDNGDNNDSEDVKGVDLDTAQSAAGSYGTSMDRPSSSSQHNPGLVTAAGESQPPHHDQPSKTDQLQHNQTKRKKLIPYVLIPPLRPTEPAASTSKPFASPRHTSP